MKVRVTWRSEITIEGKDLDEVRNKWGGMDLFSRQAKEAGAEYVEIVSAEKCDNTGYPQEDITSEFNS